jgi:mannose-6-phosphate isomerase-like protein (cupin superfamily)
MLIKKNQAIRKENSDNCVVFEYDYDNLDSGFAIAEINGRYPSEGKSMNLDCDQVYYVISGEAKLFSDKGEFKIEQGDLYYFEKKEVYYIIGDNLKVCIINFPKWNLKQYKLIKDK